ncbi:acetylornithine deacetylase/succinyl-diaminopimelate desuccinylase-like protein [Kineococcus xinjiangensis]|uniref:Acetylornithine deacetylase/succinyl-diaminopimelate desuccinylase-like protein n=1 Tax=Kineococcus xinjiangensis TaxID=512762 RepID=A0A2S6IM85_9ACTN|nr:dipeptidase [Kineococcus xinjiangensis]PPK95308.1 acetylornithine deacetylase/succinyl-diaminopimelate desuccinylase-like protein [Kineococcus xinjiangensis]
MTPEQPSPQPVPAPQGPGGSARSGELRARLAELQPGLRADLERLVRIPSVSAPAFDPGHVAAGAEAVAGLLRDAGLDDVRILTAEQDGRTGAPAVVGRRPAPPGRPTVLLYAHHDVQPPGAPADWTSPAFEPTERGGRLYGRGAADDKAGVMAHVAALRALLPQWGPGDGVGVTVFVEGEEEIGSPTFSAFLAQYRDVLAADVIVVADSANWRVGVPALTTTLRGLVDCVVRVDVLTHAVHSGINGGPVVDALTCLCRLLATLHDEAGDVAVAGLLSGRAPETDLTEERFRADVGVLDGVRLAGTGSLESRLWTKPALSVIGLDAPSVELSSNTLLPTARAKLSVRLGPGQDPAAAMAALRAHLEERAPFGARVTVEEGELGAPFAADTSTAAHATARRAFTEAYGVEVVEMGMGGSIPFISELAAVYPHAAILVTGVEDPDSRAHGADESLHLEDFARACLAHALLLDSLAGGPAGPVPAADGARAG